LTACNAIEQSQTKQKINSSVFKNRSVGHKAESYFKRNAINKPCAYVREYY